jgi:hypothetical protein
VSDELFDQVMRRCVADGLVDLLYIVEFFGRQKGCDDLNNLRWKRVKIGRLFSFCCGTHYGEYHELSLRFFCCFVVA